MNAISVLEDYSLFSQFGTDMLKALKNVNRAVDLDSFLNKKQSNIDDYFETLLKTCGRSMNSKLISLIPFL